MGTVCLVALICSALSRWEQAEGHRAFAGSRYDTSTWVRTVDGWESPRVLSTTPKLSTQPSLHPLLVAGFQLAASLLALIAFPAACSRAEAQQLAKARGSGFRWKLLPQRP